MGPIFLVDAVLRFDRRVSIVKEFQLVAITRDGRFPRLFGLKGESDE